MKITRFIFIVFSTLIPTFFVGAADVTVIGSRENEAKLMGAGQIINTEQIKNNTGSDINRLLRQVPGVYVREEDGLGLFPNISLRGVDPNRSSKVNLMEDGVLIAPAPYSAPAAYFFPNADRMSGIEILKGSSQIKYGPTTTGGVINFISSRPPEQDGVVSSLRNQFGSFGDQKIHLLHGQKKGAWSYQVDLYNRSIEGFKQLDQALDAPNTSNTGQRITEPQLFLSYETQSGLYQRFDLKWGQSHIQANETYLGISDEDFKQNSRRRYSATRFDNFESTHERAYLRHFIEITPQLHLTSTLYQNRFERVWYKLERAGGKSLGQALADPQTLAILRGEAAGSLTIRNNDRGYVSRGLDEILTYEWHTSSLKHQTQLGVRIHEDYILNRNHDDILTQEANNSISAIQRGAPGNSKDGARALSTYLEHALSWGNWTLSPGLRSEQVTFIQEDRTDGSKLTKNLQTTTAGIGVNYQVDDKQSYFAGLYQGVGLPSPGDFIKNDIRPERSQTLEIGSRYFSEKKLFSWALFYSEFQDLYVPANLVSGASVSENAGRIDSMGLELQFQRHLTPFSGFYPLFFLTTTLTQSTLKNDSNSQSSGSFFSGGKKGNKVPYVPETQINTGLSAQKNKFSSTLTLNYSSRSWSTAQNIDGTAQDMREGEIPSFHTIDARIAYAYSKETSVNFGVFNLSNQEYIVSRHAHGPRPGRPQSFYIGLETQF